MSLSLSCKSKVKSYCKRIWSPENIVRVVAVVSTRITLVIVWCCVVWSLLGRDALPFQYFIALKDGTCFSARIINLTSLENDSIVTPSVSNNFTNNSELSHISSFILDSNFKLVQFKKEQCDYRPELRDVTLDLNWTVVSIANVKESSSLIRIPCGHFFALVLLLIFSSVCGYLAKLVFLPSLFGMIIAGILLRNVPQFDFAQYIQPTWSSTIRNIALVIILIRGGLSMRLEDLKRLKYAVLILGSLPCILEGAVDGITATFYLKMPWQWGFMLGYIIAAISPAIVVPTSLSLQEDGYGKASGELTLIVAAASIDVVIAISIFGVFFGLAFSEGSLVLDIFRGPIQIVIGLLYGVIFGLLLWLIPSKHFKKGSKVRNQFFLLFGLGLFALFGSRRAIIGGSNLAASGALAVLVLAFVCRQGWTESEKNRVSRGFLLIWQMAQPLLFALIGAEIDFDLITASLVGQGMLVIIIGLIVRFAVTFISTFGGQFHWRTRLFISLSWIPKATVQAAIGPLALEFAMVRRNSSEVQLGQRVLTISVLAILLTAPLGAVSISLLGPILLKKSNEVDKNDGVSVPAAEEVPQRTSKTNSIKETTV